MSRTSFFYVSALAAVVGSTVSAASAFITIPTVPIGNVGNSRDTTTYGAVGYRYNIGTTEVTNAQYAAFLNAVAATDTYSLYNVSMAGSFGGITRAGSPGSFTYSTISGRENNPVNYVSFWDATRFANWLHNGQGSGNTENGAYTLTSAGIANNTISRNAGWQWAVTSDDEWFKAAYFQPSTPNATNGFYWLYPVSSNSISPTLANSNNVVGNTVPVGSYAPNYYGTFDMAGNVWEWTEGVSSGSPLRRALRGGAFDGNVFTDPRKDGRRLFGATVEVYDSGFRVSAIPGPGSVALLAIGGLGAARRRRPGG